MTLLYECTNPRLLCIGVVICFVHSVPYTFRWFLRFCYKK